MSWSTQDLSPALRRLQSDTQDFWAPLHSIRRVDASSLTPLQFHREFVSRNVPVVLLNAMTSPKWQFAMANWQNDDHLIAKSGDHPVTVDVTPFGFGDAVLELPGNHGDVFVMPEERDMSMAEFMKILKNRDEFDGVPYLSHQNDSLREQFPELFDEVPPAMELAVEAFGNEPEAVNIWFGDERAVSTMHKDHYENFYCVVKGQKHFTLLPPSSVGCLYEREFRPQDTVMWILLNLKRRILWWMLKLPSDFIKDIRNIRSGRFCRHLIREIRRGSPWIR
ncbi:hypothetical protein L914_08852 [Phytophthora nicotianae]|uniref:JmjC domain-containing protein n=1 Tax=Phytophthora nicotianae TaxID=4792 RepID=W2NC94_PHYNI|nr:hypothetical protein L914_08852 [Phytophthora nicotianae]